MKRLTINMPRDNGIYYKSFRYPAGEVQVRLTKLGLETLEKSDSFEIITSQIPDLMELAQLVDAINHVKIVDERRLFLKYLPYGRADRRFVDGDSFGLLVFAKMISTLNLTSVWTFDAHNERMSQLLFNTVGGGTTFANMKPTHDAVDQILPCLRRMKKESGLGYEEIALISPDEGATKRYDLSKYDMMTFVGGKKRDPETGNLTGFHIDPNIVAAKAALIVDDICDGGGTFIGLAEEIRKVNPYIKLGLYVSHGIFSKGVAPLLKHFQWLFASDYTFKNGERSDAVYLHYFGKEAQ